MYGRGSEEQQSDSANSAVRGRARLKISQAGDLGCMTLAARLYARCVARSCVHAQNARKQQPTPCGVAHIVEFFLKIIFSSLASLRARCPRRTAEAIGCGCFCLLVTYMPLACVVGRAHDASSKGKTRPLSSKDTTASSHPALEIIAFACSLSTAG